MDVEEMQTRRIAQKCEQTTREEIGTEYADTELVVPIAAQTQGMGHRFGSITGMF